MSLVGLQDIDGDGCTEYVIGGVDYNVRSGFVAVVSGRTGAFLRVTYDPTPGGIMGYPLATAGDMDRDGVMDYATGNYWGGGGQGAILAVYSGATGAVIRHWRSLAYNIADSILGGRDIDLDGVVDVITGSHYYPPNGPYRDKRLFGFSSHDQQEVMHVDPLRNVSSGDFGDKIVDLGTQPGSPYPIFAHSYTPLNTPGYLRTLNRLEVWRTSPPGVHVTGEGCSNAGFHATAGVRLVDTPQGEQCRVVLGSAPPGAVAWCFAAGASNNTYAGSPLPLALDAYSFPGCNLYVPPTLSAACFVGTAGFERGYAAFDVPLQISEAGFGAAVQWLVFDFTTGDYASTPRFEVHVR